MEKINGNTLIALGFESDKWFADAITHINENKLSEKEMGLYLKQFKRPPILVLHQETIPFELNIKVESELEESNVQSVTNTMNEVMKTPTVINGTVMPDACLAGSIGTIPVGVHNRLKTWTSLLF